MKCNQRDSWGKSPGSRNHSPSNWCVGGGRPKCTQCQATVLSQSVIDILGKPKGNQNAPTTLPVPQTLALSTAQGLEIADNHFVLESPVAVFLESLGLKILRFDPVQQNKAMHTCHACEIRYRKRPTWSLPCCLLQSLLHEEEGPLWSQDTLAFGNIGTSKLAF